MRHLYGTDRVLHLLQLFLIDFRLLLPSSCRLLKSPSQTFYIELGVFVFLGILAVLERYLISSLGHRRQLLFGKLYGSVSSFKLGLQISILHLHLSDLLLERQHLASGRRHFVSLGRGRLLLSDQPLSKYRRLAELVVTQFGDGRPMLLDLG